jgi:integrase
MIRPPRKPPSYRLHKPSGQAVVTLNGKDHYLGPHGSETSRQAYDRIVGQWQANGRRLPEESAAGTLMKEVIAAYWCFADGYYRKHGKPTSQHVLIHYVLGVLRDTYAEVPVIEFSPLDLKSVRQRFVDAGLVRNTCNQHVARIKRMFRWAAEEEMVPAAVYHALQCVSGLKRGRTEAPDRPPIGPVPEEHVKAVLARVRPAIATMIRLQSLTGMRPAEVVLLRGCDIDRSGPVWTYTPETHKSEHCARDRVVFLGPRAQELLHPWLDRTPDQDRYLFRPRSWSDQRRRSDHKSRGVPMRGVPGERYLANSYAARIRAACKAAGIPIWSPNRLRHAAGTKVRQQYGLEGAQVILGHAKADVTEIYAERDTERARQIAMEIG